MGKKIKRRIIIRHSDKPDTMLKKLLMGLFRFLLLKLMSPCFAVKINILSQLTWIRSTTRNENKSIGG